MIDENKPDTPKQQPVRKCYFCERRGKEDDPRLQIEYSPAKKKMSLCLECTVAVFKGTMAMVQKNPGIAPLFGLTAEKPNESKIINPHTNKPIPN